MMQEEVSVCSLFLILTINLTNSEGVDLKNIT